MRVTWCLLCCMVLASVGLFAPVTRTDASSSYRETPANPSRPRITENASRLTSSRGIPANALHSAPAPAGNLFITHSTTQNITALNSVACNNGGIHTINSYYRVFDLVTEFGITDPIQVDELSFGVEQAASGAGTQTVIVRLYTLSGPFILANLTQIGSETLAVPDGATGTIFTTPFDPVVVVPANQILVAEVYTPDGAAGSNSFFIGSNADPETAPSYLRAPACGISQPTTTGAIGFPNMHIVMNVSAGIIVATPTSTPIPPSPTPEPPTATPQAPTSTPEPPTATPIPPSSTPTSSSPTPVPATPTATTVPPSATPTVLPATPTVSPTDTPKWNLIYLPLTRRR